MEIETILAFGILAISIFQLVVLQEQPQPESLVKLSLEQTVYELRDELEGWYNYNLTNKGKTLSEEELKELGGVCKHYSEWYTSESKKKGFQAIDVIINTGNRTHMFSVISDHTGYCIADQTRVKCLGLGK